MNCLYTGVLAVKINSSLLSVVLKLIADTTSATRVESIAQISSSGNYVATEIIFVLVSSREGLGNCEVDKCSKNDKIGLTAVNWGCNLSAGSSVQRKTGIL